MKYKILDNIHKPSDLKKLAYKDLDLLAVRDKELHG